MPRANVFVGSTKDDLLEYRLAVRRAIESLDCHPIMMEDWPASDNRALDYCMAKVDEADIYIGIFARRYGFCPPNHLRSITELEFDRATQQQKIRLCFMLDPKAVWPDEFTDTGEKARLLQSFKDRIDLELIRTTFTTPADLETDVQSALAEALLENDIGTNGICNLVPRPERFVGRESELAALQAALDSSGQVAITALKGMAGIGKSTLVKAFAHQPKNPFGLRLWAELGEKYRGDLFTSILRTWAHLLTGQELPTDISQADLEDRVRTIIQAAARQRCRNRLLLVIDDVWPDTIPVARKLRSLVEPLNPRVLITTRTEEVSAALHCRSQSLETLSPQDGAALLIDHINHPRAADARAELEKLSVALGGHALALTLMARYLRADFQPSRIPALTADIQDGITVGKSFKELQLDLADNRNDSVATSLELNYNALGGGNANLKSLLQSQFRALGALPPDLPFRDDYAYALWKTKPDKGLRDLAANGLVAADVNRDLFYSQHRLLHAYSRALLRDAGELAEMTFRYHEFVIIHTARYLSNPQETWDVLTEDDLSHIHAVGNALVAAWTGTRDPAKQDKILSALQTPAIHIQYNDPKFQCRRFANAVHNYVIRRSIGVEGRRWLQMGLHSARQTNDAASVMMLGNKVGLWHYHRKDIATALRYYDFVLPVTRQHNDRRAEAATLNNIGLAYASKGEHDRAIGKFKQALPLSRETKDREGEGATLHNLASSHNALKQPTQALHFFGEALTIRREQGNKRGEAVTLNSLGKLYTDMGDRQRALAHLYDALKLRQEVRDRSGESITRFNIAINLWEMGKQVAAREQMKLARDINAQLGLPTTEEELRLSLWEDAATG